jgi:ABC-type bacteriocin/lantibiotic exporter with double-glycine peptidase domain
VADPTTPPPPAAGRDEAGSLAVLASLARIADVGFDPTRAAQAVRAAAREVPPTLPRAARLRLAQASEALGVQLVPRQLSVREALGFVARQAPLALFTVTPVGSARWFVLAEARGGRGRLEGLAPDDPAGWLAADELARLFGAADPDAVLEWHLAQPAAPMAGAAARGGEAHHGHAPAGGHGGHAHHMPPFRRLLGLLRPETGDLWVVLLFAVGVGVFTLATPVVAMAVVNSVALGTLLQQLVVLCAALFVALALAGLLQFLQTVTVEYIQRRVFVRVADDLAHRLPRVDLRAFDRQHGPELVNRFFDVLTVQKAGATLLLDGVTVAIQILLGLVLLGFYDTYLLGFDLVLVACLIVLFFVLGRGAVRTAVRESIAKYAVAGWMEEVARHPVAFKTAGGPRLAREKTDALCREYLLARADHFRVLARQLGFALMLQAGANVALLAIGGVLVIRGDLTLGELVAAEIVVTLVVATFAKLYKQLEAYYDLLAAVDKLGHLIDLPLERDGGATHQPRTGGAAVAVHDVSFGYEGGHRDVLSHLSLRLEPGERVALVGPNGAGKSTLADVLFGLRAPESGWVEIDGADLRSLRLDTLREHVAVVKGVEAIEGTILDNVRMGRDDVTLADVQTALRWVGLLDAVMDLPDGLDTRLWTGGSPLSLGQANRLMVARAVVGQPRLLILDEALDHMDSDVRETVLPAVLGPDARWTVLIVTHSDEVARLCDRVVRMDRPGVAAHAPAGH